MGIAAVFSKVCAAVGFGLFVAALMPALLFAGLWLTDWLDAIRRICPVCKRRGVTQGKGQVFVADYDYDSWRFCKNCQMFFTGVNGDYKALGEFRWPHSK